MKILLDGRMVGTKVHGIGRYTLDLIHGLHKQGHEISIIYHEPQAPASFRPGVIQEVLHLPTAFASPLESLALSRLGRLWDLKKYDVIHFPSFAVPLPWASLPWEKVIITIHDPIHFTKGQSLKYKIYYEWVVKGALKKARAVLTVSDWSKGEIIKYFSLPKTKVHGIRNGLEDTWFLKKNLPASPPTFISLGNIKNHKNIKTLMDAARELWDEGENFNLTLSLSGNDLPKEWELPQNQKNRIRILKNVDDTQLKTLIQESVALVSPSLMEGFNYPAAEALALGTPVILSTGTAHDEISGSLLHFYGAPMDKTGLKVEMKKALAKNSDSQKQPDGASPHNIQTVDEMVRKILSVYQA